MRDNPLRTPSFGTALAVWLQLGVTSIGGPAAHISLMHTALVSHRNWFSERDFSTALNFCMLLPGPEAQQLATYLGWRLHGTRGAIAAGGLFILPGAVAMGALSWLSASHGDTPWIRNALAGTLPVVSALIGLAVLRMARRNLGHPPAVGLATAALVALAWLHIPFPWILGAAAAIGLGLRRTFAPADQANGTDSSPRPDGTDRGWRPVIHRAVWLSLIFGALWVAPVGLVIGLFGPSPYLDVARVFGQAAWVTFGGAYAVVPFVTSLAVEQHHWISQADMLHGLALAETLPGPLILTNQYVGYLVGWNAGLTGNAGGLSPPMAAAISAGLATWMTFLPCFYFVLSGAPAVERLAHDNRIRAAMSGVTCAVVGVIASLGLVVAKTAFWPDGHPDAAALLIGLVSLAALGSGRVPAVGAIAASALLGGIRTAIG